MGSNLRHADNTALCAELQEEAERLIGKVNNMYSKSKTTEIVVKQTKFPKSGKMQSDVGVIVDDEKNGGGRTFQIYHIAEIS